jgi:two-component sensor histidine kinase
MRQSGSILPSNQQPLHRALLGESVTDEEFECLSEKGTTRSLLVSATTLKDELDGTPTGAVCVALDITDRRKHEELRELLIHELNHRVKNTLATVQSITNQTLRATTSNDVGRAALSDRLLALSRAHDLLTKETWLGASLNELLVSSVEPYGEHRFLLEGPAVRLLPNTAVTLALVFAELATNAAKYGALSTSGGRVRVTWDVTSENTLVIEWRESGGPRVETPSRTGFGTRLFSRSLKGADAGEVSLRFLPEGLVCILTLTLPKAELEGGLA